MVHLQRLQDVLVNVVVVILAGNALHDVACHRRCIVGISRCGSRRVDARGQVLLHILTDGREILRVLHE